MMYQSEKTAVTNDLEFVYDSFGDPANPAMVLVMGLGAQLIAWPDDFCGRLAALGLWVIRFDNRDVGLSTKLDEAGVPNLIGLVTALMIGKKVKAPYLVKDMAADCIGLMDALGIEQAHLLGVSMGGMIVQEAIIHFPERVKTAVSIMSTTGDRSLPQATPEARALLMKPAPTDRAGYIENGVASGKVLWGKGHPFPEEYIREQAARYFDRGLSPAGTARQLAAIFASGSRREALKQVTVPTLVIHGDDDPLVRVEGGRDTAVSIPNAKLLIIEGMGHNLPREAWDEIVGAIGEHIG
jgi:pimeloyl-ACP methyl ester carboxylesterase